MVFFQEFCESVLVKISTSIHPWLFVVKIEKLSHHKFAHLHVAQNRENIYAKNMAYRPTVFNQTSNHYTDRSKSHTVNKVCNQSIIQFNKISRSIIKIKINWSINPSIIKVKINQRISQSSINNQLINQAILKSNLIIQSNCNNGIRQIRCTVVNYKRVEQKGIHLVLFWV